MSFNENTFILAGTAIAIAGVGLYIWDSRVSKSVHHLGQGFMGNSQQNNNSQQGYNSGYQNNPLGSRNSYSFGGKSKKNKLNELHKKTKRRNK